MKRLITLLCLILFPPVFYAQAIGSHMSDLIKHNLPNAHIGIMLMDAKTGAIIFQRNAYQLFKPASNTKLFTAAAMLWQINPRYRYKTTLAKKGDTVYIKFTGDPSLTIPAFKRLLHHLKKKGIRTIKDNIVIDDTRYVLPYHKAATTLDDVSWGYAAPVSAIVLNENALAYRVKTSTVLEQRISIKPLFREARYVTLTNRIKTVTKRQAKNECELRFYPEQRNHINLTGCLAMRKHDMVWKMAVPNPFLLASRIIRAQLKQDGIILQGHIVKGKMPKKVKRLAVQRSKPLYELVEYMLSTSDNLYADSFLKTLGYQFRKEGSFQQGIQALKGILAEHTNIDTTHLKIEDGSGSRYDLVSPFQMSQLLLAVYHDKKVKSSFLAALPRSGFSGTLAHRMQVFDLKGQVFAKTGTMHDTSALSGFVTSVRGRPLIYSIMINHIDKGASHAKQLENLLLGAIVENL